MDPNLDIVIEVQKAGMAKVKEHYFEILKIRWTEDLNKQEITFID